MLVLHHVRMLVLSPTAIPTAIPIYAAGQRLLQPVGLEACVVPSRDLRDEQAGSVLPCYPATLLPSYPPTLLPSYHPLFYRPTVLPSYLPTIHPTVLLSYLPVTLLSYCPTLQPSALQGCTFHALLPASAEEDLRRRLMHQDSTELMDFFFDIDSRTPHAQNDDHYSCTIVAHAQNEESTRTPWHTAGCVCVHRSSFWVASALSGCELPVSGCVACRGGDCGRAKRQEDDLRTHSSKWRVPSTQRPSEESAHAGDYHNIIAAL